MISCHARSTHLLIFFFLNNTDSSSFLGCFPAAATCHRNRRLRSIPRGREQTRRVHRVFSCSGILLGHGSRTQISQISQTHHHSIYNAPHTLLVLSWGVINLPLCQCCAPLKVHQNTRAAAYLAVAAFAGAEIAAS